MLAITACKHEPPVAPEPGDDDGGGGNEQPCDPNVVYFQQQILPLLAAYCTDAGCHNAADQADDINLTTYEGVTDPGVVRPFELDRKLYRAITDNDPDDRMPLGRPPLTQEQIFLIRDWILQGALNNSCVEAGCDTLNVTYSGTIAPIIQQRCQGCHSGSTPQAGLDLTSWSVLNALATDGRLVEVVNHAPQAIPMPPTGPKLPACNIRQIELWVAAGAPNN